MRKLVLSCAGVGFIPGAPGTYATVLTLAVFLFAQRLGAPWWVWPVAAAASGVLLLVVGVPDDPAGGRSDPKWCVLDEVCGTFVTVSLMPGRPVWLVAAGALVFFRLFDILKPPPVDLLERLRGSWGVLADDVAAGVLANVCLRLLLFAVGLL